ncbi:MAG: DinB family protein [Anaerolineae bacterium]
MQIADIRLMFDYNFWANRLLLAKAAEVTPEQFVAPTTHSWGSLRGTLAHVLDSEHGWLRIVQTGEVMFDELLPEAFPTVAAMRQRWDAEEAAWDAYLGSLTDADMPRIIRYEVEEGIRERAVALPVPRRQSRDAAPQRSRPHAHAVWAVAWRHRLHAVPAADPVNERPPTRFGSTTYSHQFQLTPPLSPTMCGRWRSHHT